MTRTLPENTVDAWTAIALANQGASAIWLPTQRAGKTNGGTHPSDVSLIGTGRLVLIENKAVEAATKIDFGGNHEDQNKALTDLQEMGQKLMTIARDDAVGWVAYGLPHPRPWLPTEFNEFGDSQWLACPHEVAPANLKSSRFLLELAWGGGKSPSSRHGTTSCLACSVPAGTHGPPRRLHLSELGRMTRAGRFGIPLKLVHQNKTNLLQVARGHSAPDLSSTANINDVEFDLLDLISDLAEASAEGASSSKSSKTSSAFCAALVF